MYKKRILIIFLILVSLGLTLFITFSGANVNVSDIMPKLLLLGGVAAVLFVIQFALLPKPDPFEDDDIETRIDMVNAKNQMIETLSQEGYVLDLSGQCISGLRGCRKRDFCRRQEWKSSAQILSEASAADFTLVLCCDPV